jgi:multiple sugar transport system substrate-binding protein
VLEDLTPYLDDDVVEDYYPEALATRTIDGRIYGLPMEQEPLAIFYDVAALEDAGLSEADLPSTWEDMLELGRRLTTGQRAGLVLDTTPSYYQNFTFYPWMWQGGGEVVDPGTQRSGFASDAVVQALQLYSDSVSTGAAPRTLPAAGDVVGAFRNGFAAMWQTGVWQVEGFAQNAPDHEYGVLTLPTPPGGEAVTSLGGWAFVVNSKGRDPEAAAQFTAATIGSMSQESIDAGVQWNGVGKGNIPARRSVTEAIGDTGAFENPWLQYFRDEVLPGGRGEPRYPPPVLKAVSNAIQAVQLAGADPVEQAETAHRAIESYLVTYEGAELR